MVVMISKSIQKYAFWPNFSKIWITKTPRCVSIFSRFKKSISVFCHQTNILHQFNLTCNVFERVDFYSLPIDKERKNDEICIFFMAAILDLSQNWYSWFIMHTCTILHHIEDFQNTNKAKKPKFWIFLIFELLLSAILNISNCSRVTIGHPV